MSQSTESRIVLAVTITALFMSMVWIFSEISAESPATENSVWRYTSQGWMEMSDLANAPSETTTGPLDNVSPLVWGAGLLLAGMTILIGFTTDPIGIRSKDKRLDHLERNTGSRNQVTFNG